MQLRRVESVICLHLDLRNLEDLFLPLEAVECDIRIPLLIYVCHCYKSISLSSGSSLEDS